MSLVTNDHFGKIFAEGKWISGGGGTRPVSNPATGARLGELGLASVTDVDDAAAAARDAQSAWATTPFTERARVLRRAGDLWHEHAAEIKHWLIAETGAVDGFAGFQILTSAQECYEAAALAAYPSGEVLRSNSPRLSLLRRVPVGTVGVIAPFNVPTILAIRAVAPALALGNAVVLKPDPRTGISGGVLLAALFEEAGVPPGVLAMLPGDGAVGEAVVSHPGIPVIAFTGSTGAGRAVARVAAEHLKRVHLELGGNSALLVLDDVDLEVAASTGAFGSFNHQGQICMATSRHIVDGAIADEYAAALARHADALAVGDPASGHVALGPVIDEGQRDRIHDIVTSSVARGAVLETGGTYDGLFYRPTVLARTPVDAPAFTQEIFGPVAPVTSFASIDDAVRLAGSTSYGLSLGILTRDIGRALEIADRLPVGMVHINDQTVNDEAQVAFGGMGDSGNGARHGGIQTNLEAFTEAQWVTLRSTPPAYPF
ncbi:aldehyde dehydrogenase family protein [Streptomyces sp. NPDC029041]|uniref:aldehyde dehydrogenase family protein n=1 Tax=Streptomyces sp. NPDC029041 TaxID=3155727 RepID=UPI0033DD1DF9